MAKGKHLVEERKKRNREYQKRWREKMNRQPEVKEEFLKKERERWAKRVKDGKVKNISDMEEREKRQKRKVWKHAQRESRERRRKAEEGWQSLSTPPESPLEMSFEEPRSSRQQLTGERLQIKTRKRHAREMKALREKLKNVQKEKEESD